jgi:hypothetical protein
LYNLSTAGEKFRFVKAAASSSRGSSSLQQPASNLRVPKESAAIISHAVINRFNKEGYVYRGRVALSRSPNFVKESTAAAEVAATADALTGVSSADAADTADAASAADITASTDSADAALVQVALVRVDHSGNLYTKT